jgi:hypothetical protein
MAFDGSEVHGCFGAFILAGHGSCINAALRRRCESVAAGGERIQLKLILWQITN